jgi:phage terminase large subunit-like protein
MLHDGALSDAWSTALPDWKERIRTRQSLVPDLPLDMVRAEKALRIFKQLRVPDLKGRPTHGEVCEPWVFEIVRAIFGAFDAETQERMIREYFLMIPKKNGKSSLAAGVMVTAQILNETPAEELLLVAPTLKIANISFKQASGIIRWTVMKSGVALQDLFSLHPSDRKIKHLNPDCPSEMVVLASDSNTVTGSKAGYVLVDETHEFSAQARASDVFVELRGGTAHPDKVGFFMQITTQSKKPPQGVFAAELKKAREVRDGKLRLPLLPILYELPLEMAREGGWKDPKVWGLVNPNLGLSVSETFLTEQLIAAEAKGPDALNVLASQHFNVEIGQGQGDYTWVGVDFWPGALDETVRDLTDIIGRCEVAVVGIDGGGADDLGGLYVIGRERDTRHLLGWAHAWAHPTVLQRRKEIIPALQDFASDEDLTLCEYATQDHDEMCEIVAALMDAGLLPEEAAVGLDAAGVTALVDALAGIGVSASQMVAVAQGYRLSAAIWGMERKLMDGTFRHGGQRLMAWCLANAKAEQRGNAVLITKETAGKAKIDPLIAMFNAFMLMSRNPVAGQAGSYLDQAELMVI